MGLDNGFVLKQKSTGNEIHLFHFRNYYELAQFVRNHKALVLDDDEYMYHVTKELLQELQALIKPIYDELHKLPMKTVSCYDDNGYPKKYQEMFYEMEFNPVYSSSSFAGSKLLRLYERIQALLEILDGLDESADWEVQFYDSY